jgi:DMSO/TMAO reductase YedYZ molybdopterin-dependent catalytic subunit
MNIKPEIIIAYHMAGKKLPPERGLSLLKG